MQNKILTSSSNPLFKTLKSLLSSKGLRTEGQCLVPGAKLIREILEAPSPRRGPSSGCIPLALVGPQGFEFGLQTKIQRLELSKDLFRELDNLGTGHPLLLCQIPKPKESDFSKEPQGLEIIAPLQDPQNMGALIRSAAAFGIRCLHLTKESCHPFLPKALKSAANGILHIEFKSLQNTEDLFKIKQNLFILDPGGKDLQSIFRSKNFTPQGYLLVGEEGQGHSKIKDLVEKPWAHAVSIPTQNVESLNATVASSIFLYEWSNQVQSIPACDN